MVPAPKIALPSLHLEDEGFSAAEHTSSVLSSPHPHNICAEDLPLHVLFSSASLVHPACFWFLDTSQWTFLKDGKSKGVPISPFLDVPAVVIKDKNEEVSGKATMVALRCPSSFHH